MTTYTPLEAVTNLPWSEGIGYAYWPNDVGDPHIVSEGDRININLGPYVLCEATDTPSLQERQTAALESIASEVATFGLVDNPLWTSALLRIAVALERIVGQMEQRP